MKKIDMKELAAHADQAWGDSHDLLWKIIKKRKLRVGAEIGVAYGGHAERILHNTDVTLYCIDPYKHFADYDDPMNFPQGEFDRLFEFTKNRLKKYDKRAVFMRDLSERAVTKIKPELDFVYIDADHSYQGVLGDIIRWFPRVRAGGIMSGHDYGHVNFPGVKKAVNEFFGRFGWELHTHTSGMWWVEKESLNISFIIPAYNCARTIEMAIASILNGNFIDGDEIVIVDDKSSDETLSILSKIRTGENGVRVVSHVSNKGGGATRNTAVENCKNNLIFCLDSDNVLVTGSVKKLKETLLAGIHDVVSYQELRYFYNSTKKIDHTWMFTKNMYDKYNYLTTNKVPGASGNYLFTKTSWLRAGKYPESAGALDTWGFGLRQVMNGSTMGIAKNSFYYHRLSDNSYWVRDSKTSSIAAKATQLVFPYISYMSGSDRLRVLRGFLNYDWFSKLDTEPIRLNLENKHSFITNIIIKLRRII